MATPARSAPLVVALIVGVLAIAHVRVLVGGQTWADVAYHGEVAPARLAASDAIWAGTLPTWWDGTALGVPLAAEPSHGALAPAIWLARSARGLDWIMLAQLAWAAIGIALWARKTASDPGAVVAAILVGASGLFVATALRGSLPAIAHLPWLALCATNLATAPDRSRAAIWAVGLGGALGLVGLAGQLGVLVDAVALAIVIGARRASWRWLAAAIAAGLAIACAQWIPAFAIAGTTAGITIDPLPVARLVELIAPAPAHHDWPSVFVGAPLLALGLVSAISWRRIALALALGAIALVGGRAAWPAILGVPHVHLAVLVVVLAPQIAAGVDALYAGERRARYALAIGAGCSLVALIGLVARTPVAAHGGTLIDGMLGILCIAGALTIAWRPGEAGTAARAIIAVLMVAPSLGALGVVAPLTDRAVLDEPRWAELAQHVPTPRRMFRSQFLVGVGRDPKASALPFDDEIATLVGDFGARFGIASARSDDPARTMDLDAAFQASAFEGGALLDRYGIALWIVPSTVVGSRRLPELAHRLTWSLVEAPVAPAASVVRGAVYARTPAATFALLFPIGGGMGVPRGTIALAGGGDSHVDTAPPVACAIDAWDPGAIALGCTGPGYAVVSSTAAPGWAVTIDGAAATALTADAIRRAVAIPAGPHAIAWRYTAPGGAIGLGCAGGGVLVLGALAVLSRRRTARPASPARTASPAS